MINYKQILTDKERQSIRSNLYSASKNEASNLKDKKIAFFMRFTRGLSVLDLGCVDHNPENYRSCYWLHKAIKDSAKKVIGLDYYREGVLKLKAIGYDVIEGDAQSFDLLEKFDAVTAGDLIEHLTNLDGFMLSVNNALNPGGVLVISTPNPWCWKYFMYHVIFKKLTPINREHVTWFCVQTLENLGLRYGFEIIEYEYSSRRLYERLIPLPKHLKHTTIGLVFRKTQ